MSFVAGSKPVVSVSNTARYIFRADAGLLKLDGSIVSPERSQCAVETLISWMFSLSFLIGYVKI